MWMDNETKVDLIGFDIHAELIKSIVMDKSMLPVTIGIFGDWGSGKTSMIKMLESKLEKEEGTVCVYFNSWTFEGYDDAKTAIISSIIEALKQNQKIGSKIKDQAENLIKSVNWMRALKFGFKEIAIPLLETSLTGFPITFIDKMGSLLGECDEKIDFKKIFNEKSAENDKYSEIQDGIRNFRNGFDDLINKTELKRIVVLIDDLDRCSPDRIVDNLEAIKLFLNVDRTAFIMCADPRIVRHAIALRYENIVTRSGNLLQEYSTDMLITDYLEKLIQVPYYLPRLSPTEIETYMSLLFCQNELVAEEFNRVIKGQNIFWDKNRYWAYGIKEIRKVLGTNDKYKQLYSELEFCNKCSGIIAEGLKGNPRQVKRFLNTYTLRKKLSEVAKLKCIRDDVLVKLMILEYSNDALFNYLYKKQVIEGGYPEVIKKLEMLVDEGKIDLEEFKKVDSEFSTQFAMKWLNLNPKLSDIDLRDYYWIARDKIQNNSIAAELIPQYIKELLIGLLSGINKKEEIAAEGVNKLEDDEKSILFNELLKEIDRHPKEKKSYDAINNMVKKAVDGSVDLQIKILNTNTDLIPPAVGLDIYNYMNINQKYKEKIEPVLKDLSLKDTRIGRALKIKLEKKWK